MFTREEPAAREVIDPRTGVPARNEYTFASHTFFVIPQDCDPMGGVFTAQAD